MACNVVDRAIQAFGAEGLSQDQELASMYAQLRTLRFADVRVIFLSCHPWLTTLFIGTGCSKYITWLTADLMYLTSSGPYPAGWSEGTETSAGVAQARSRVW
jgi:hypothetical protein